MPAKRRRVVANLEAQPLPRAIELLHQGQEEERELEQNEGEGEEEEEEEEEGREAASPALHVNRLLGILGLPSVGGNDGILSRAAALPGATGIPETSVHGYASASVATLALLHRATQICSVLVSENGPGADESGPPGDVNDTRFLKGLRLGAADESAVKQYTAMGIWRRLATLNQLARSAAQRTLDQLQPVEPSTASSAAGPPSLDGSVGTFKEWYTDKFTTTFEDELDAIRQHPGFGGRDVNQLIGCIEGGAAVFRSIDEHLRNHL